MGHVDLRKSENAVIYWEDETGIDNCSSCERGLAPKGQPLVLPVKAKRERLNMLSGKSAHTQASET